MRVRGSDDSMSQKLARPDAARISRQLYTRRIVTASDNEPAYRIIQRLRAARLGLVAVLNRERHLRGIVTIEDLIRRLVSSSEARV